MSTKRKRRDKKHLTDRRDEKSIGKNAESIPDQNATVARGMSIWMPVTLILAGVAVYWSSFSGAFMFDDDLWIINDEKIRSLSPITKFLIGDRRPVVTFSLAVNYALGELDTWGYHLVNLTIHLLTALTLFGCIRRTMLTPAMRDRFAQSSASMAFAAALLWVIHPLNTQSVTYIIQRAESMMGLFYMLTLYTAIRGSERGGRIWYACAVLACASGMASKAVMISAPAMVFLYDWIFLSRSIGEAIRRRWGLYLGLFGTLLLLIPMGIVGGVFSGPQNRGASVGFHVASVTPLEYLISQPGVLLHYIRLTILPVGLCLDYGWPVATGIGDFLIQGLIILSLLAGTLWGILRRSWIGFIGAWFFLILAPTSSVIPIKDLAYEHRMYLPLAGVIILLLAATTYILNRIQQRGFLGPHAKTATSITLIIAISATLGITTSYRNRVYATGRSMWADVVSKRPENPRGHYNLGEQILNAGDVEESIPHFQKAILYNPKYVSAHYNLGKAYQDLGRWDDAKKAFSETVRVGPHHAKAHLELGNLFRARGQRKKALAAFQESARLDPKYASAHFNVGIAFLDMAQPADAVIALQRSAELEPDNAVTMGAMGFAYMRTGDLQAAKETLEAAINLNPKSPKTLYHLGLVYAQQKKPGQAVPYYRRAMQAGMRTANVHADLGLALAFSGDKDAAVEHLQQAIQLNPNMLSAHLHLAQTLMFLGRYDEAIDAYETLMQLNPDLQEGRRGLARCRQLQNEALGIQ